MTEQGITQDDERWIAQRMCAHESMADDLQAAIARGYERGRGESRDEIGNAVAILDEAGVECEDEIGERTLAGRVAALHRDRDRLAKRCADLESRLSVANRAEAHARAQVDGYHDIGMTTRVADVDRRLAATDARLTALVEALVPHWPSLAALRAPGEADDGGTDWKATAEFRQAQLDECRSERDTALREREEAVGVLRAMIQWQADMEREEEPVLFDSIIARARALVAGQGVADDGQSSREARVMTEAYGLVKTALAARDAEIASLRASLAEAQGEVARLRKEAHGWEHEHDSVRSSLTDALARLDAAGRLIERCMGALDGRSMALRADLRAWGK